MSLPPASVRAPPVESFESLPPLVWMAALDRLRLPLLLLDQDGRELYATAAFNAVVCREAIRIWILKTARKAAGRHLARVVEPRAIGASLPRLKRQDSLVTPVRLSRGNRGVMRTVCISGARDVGTPVVVLVSLELEIPLLPSAQALGARFGLTRREAEVALLLAQRRQNIEIAESLCVSVHTARHHTQRVLEKLGIRRRTHVGRLLQNLGSALPGSILFLMVWIFHLVEEVGARI